MKRLVHAAMGLARPINQSQYGYIPGHHGYGQNSHQSGDFAEDLATTMLASTLRFGLDNEILQ